MQFPEHRQQFFVADLGLVIHHQHHFGVTGQARADFFVGRVRCETAGVADHGADHAFTLPEAALRAPEAAEAEDREVDIFEERAEQGGVFKHKVLFRQGHRGFAARQSLFFSREHVFVHQNFRAQNHDQSSQSGWVVNKQTVSVPNTCPIRTTPVGVSLLAIAVCRCHGG
ncbi:hypothetical protein D9M73_195010 [compost metagenome]